jgi:DNA modification methylase
MTTAISHMDCLEFLATLPDDSVDLVLTDPPYQIGFDGGKGWDKQWKTEAEYLSWCKQWTAECVRVLKPGRMLIVWGTLKTDTFLRYKLDVLNSFEELAGQNEIIWSYNWGGRSKKNFARKHEYAWCYSKGKEFLFNADEVRVERKMKTSMRTGTAHDKGTIPTLIWEKNNHTMSKDFINWHPTTKNVDILQRIIAAYTNEGDTVLDIFMGSGSTAVAAHHLNRNSIGCERDDEYFEKLQTRIANAGKAQD